MTLQDSETPGEHGHSESREIVVIVGAGTMLGEAVARRFGREGAHLALVARDRENLAALVARLKEAGADAHAFPADAAHPGALRAVCGRIRETLGNPTVLVYNVSTHVPGAPTELDYDGLIAGFRSGVAGAVVAAREVAPAMRERGRGTVILTGSGIGVRPWVGGSALSMQKAALRNLAMSLHEELAPAGIHATTVTIHGVLARGTEVDPERVADEYWELHTRSRGEWRAEVRFPPRTG